MWLQWVLLKAVALQAIGSTGEHSSCEQDQASQYSGFWIGSHSHKTQCLPRTDEGIWGVDKILWHSCLSNPLPCCPYHLHCALRVTRSWDFWIRLAGDFLVCQILIQAPKTICELLCAWAGPPIQLHVLQIQLPMWSKVCNSSCVKCRAAIMYTFAVNALGIGAFCSLQNQKSCCSILHLADVQNLNVRSYNIKSLNVASGIRGSWRNIWWDTLLIDNEICMWLFLDRIRLTCPFDRSLLLRKFAIQMSNPYLVTGNIQA